MHQGNNERTINVRTAPEGFYFCCFFKFLDLNNVVDFVHEVLPLYHNEKGAFLH